MGSGNCAYWAPGVFDLDEEGFAIVVGDPNAAPNQTELAAHNCPTEAITIDTEEMTDSSRRAPER